MNRQFLKLKSSIMIPGVTESVNLRKYFLESYANPPDTRIYFTGDFYELIEQGGYPTLPRKTDPLPPTTIVSFEPLPSPSNKMDIYNELPKNFVFEDPTSFLVRLKWLLDNENKGNYFKIRFMSDEQRAALPVMNLLPFCGYNSFFVRINNEIYHFVVYLVGTRSDYCWWQVHAWHPNRSKGAIWPGAKNLIFSSSP